MKSSKLKSFIKHSPRYLLRKKTHIKHESFTVFDKMIPTKHYKLKGNQNDELKTTYISIKLLSYN